MHFPRKILFSSFVTPDFKKRQNRNETSFEEWNQIYWNIWFFGDKIINTSIIESSNYSNAGAKDDTHKKWAIAYNKKKAWPYTVFKIVVCNSFFQMSERPARVTVINNCNVYTPIKVYAVQISIFTETSSPINW